MNATDGYSQICCCFVVLWYCDDCVTQVYIISTNVVAL